MDNPLAFIMFLSLGTMLVGTIILLASTFFPHRDRTHQSLFEAGVALANVGYYTFIAGAAAFSAWLTILVVILAISAFL